MGTMRTDELYEFILERQNIYHRRRHGTTPKPWTKDTILQNYRFCNVYREQDKVTKWIADNWRTPHADNQDLWFAMCVARLFNNIDTLERIKYQVPYVPEIIEQVACFMRDSNKRVFNPAYIVSTNGVAMEKVAYVLDRVLLPLWMDRAFVRPKGDDTLASFGKRLMRFDGFAGFMVGQVVADMKYVYPLRGASDWMTFALSGPGSRRGLNRVYRYFVENSWIEKVWHSKLMQLQAEINPRLEKIGMEPLHAQDLQNCLCEWDKYERVRLNEGTPKQRYNGVKDD